MSESLETFPDGDGKARLAETGNPTTKRHWLPLSRAMPNILSVPIGPIGDYLRNLYRCDPKAAQEAANRFCRDAQNVTTGEPWLASYIEQIIRAGLEPDSPH